MSKTAAGIEQVSLSRINDWEQCPFRAKLKHVLKMKEPMQGPAIERGIKIHKSAEDYLRNKEKKFALELTPLSAELKRVKKLVGKGLARPEYQIAFTHEWKVTGYYDKDVKWRVIADVITTEPKKPVGVIDWKTGKLYEQGKYDPQLELCGMSALTAGFGDTAEGVIGFVDHGILMKSLDGPVRLKDLPKLQKKWDARAKPVMADRRFAPRPGNYCRWCHWRKDNGGPCKF